MATEDAEKLARQIESGERVVYVDGQLLTPQRAREEKIGYGNLHWRKGMYFMGDEMQVAEGNPVTAVVNRLERKRAESREGQIPMEGQILWVKFTLPYFARALGKEREEALIEGVKDYFSDLALFTREIAIGMQQTQ